MSTIAAPYSPRASAAWSPSPREPPLTRPTRPVRSNRLASGALIDRSCPSASGERGRPLLHKRCHPLAVISGAARIALHDPLAVELRPEACFECVPAHLADCRKRLRGPGGELVRKGERRVVKSFCRHDTIDQ